jgi:hypothetical protein
LVLELVLSAFRSVDNIVSRVKRVVGVCACGGAKTVGQVEGSSVETRASGSAECAVQEEKFVAKVEQTLEARLGVLGVAGVATPDATNKRGVGKFDNALLAGIRRRSLSQVSARNDSDVAPLVDGEFVSRTDVPTFREARSDLLRTLNEIALTRDVEVEGSVAEKSRLPAICGVQTLERALGCAGKFGVNGGRVANGDRSLGRVVDYSSVKTDTAHNRGDEVKCIFDFTDSVVILPRFALPLVRISRTAVTKLLHLSLVINAKSGRSSGKRSRD